MSTFTGSIADDTFVGGADPDQATGGGGNDVLFGLGGNDRLDGDDGDDSLDGGTDNDILVGGPGEDSLVGGAGSDQLYSDAVDPSFAGWMSSAGVPLDRGVSPDFLDGGAGDDYLFAGYGDSVDGGSQESYGDRLFVSFLASPVGVNADFRPLAISPDASITIGGGTISHIEYVDYLEGSNFDDTLAPINSYYPGWGPIYGRGGNDLIIAGYYSGSSYGGEGNDVIDVSASPYGLSAYGEAGDDTLTAGYNPGFLDGGDGNDILNAKGGTALGGNGDDIINDRFSSYGSNLSGGTGDDIIRGGASVTSADGGDGNDHIYGYYPAPTGPADNDTADADTLNGGVGDDVIEGNGGNDMIDGGADNDSLYGGTQNDTITGGTGDDLADGGDGDDTVYGGDGNDLLASGTGVDQLSGEAGDDRFYFGAAFGVSDLAAGGAGNDQLILQGNYSAGVSLSGSSIIQVESLHLLSASDNVYGGASAGSFSYRLTLADSATASGAALAIDASGLSATETLFVDASADTNSRFTITGGAGADDVSGGAGGDMFMLQNGGNDRAIGGGGSDGFFFGAALTGADVVDGGPGSDSLAIQGNYAAGLTLGAVTNVDNLVLLSGSSIQFGGPGIDRYSYQLATTDTNVAAGATLTVQATGLLATENLTFNGAAETNGSFRIFAGQGIDTLTGGAGSDGFLFGSDGNLTGADRVDGGSGTDSIALRGNYAIIFQNATFTNVEALVLLSGHNREYGGVIAPAGFDYDVTLANGNVATGQSLAVVGSTLGADESLRFDGRAETDGSLRIFGGAANDSLYGGSQADTLFGGFGADRLEGGGGADTYVYLLGAQSTSTADDQIAGFDWHFDRIDVPGATPRAFSQSAQGSLSTASFDADLGAQMSGVLGANQAALFTANSGTLSGHIFAVIDGNGTPGYQAGQDFVIELINPVLPIDPMAGVII